MILYTFLSNRVYSGHHTYLINIHDLEINPSLWLSVVSTHKVRDTYCSYAAIDVCCKELGSNTGVLKVGNGGPNSPLINSWHACAARVAVLSLSVCYDSIDGMV